jgi:hypothetical protein
VTREPDPTAFDDIVAALQREGGLPQWPEDGLWPEDDPVPPDDRVPAGDQPPGTLAAPLDRLPGRTAGDVPDNEISEDEIPSDDIPDDDADALPLAAGFAADPLADEHFIPPEPPPLPRLGPPILVGLTLIVLGLVLVTFPGWVGVPQVYGLPLGLVAIASGLGWLVLRLWPDSFDGAPPIYLDDPDDPDGGAVL